LQQRDERAAHRPQIDTTGEFFAPPLEWQQRVWTTEEFELADRVPVRLPESGLFAGSRGRRETLHLDALALLPRTGRIKADRIRQGQPG